ncbi:MAG: hypothetical protein ACLPVY_00825 [Acidimicrobiia bacterium]
MSTTVLAAALFVACAGGSGRAASAPATTDTAPTTTTLADVAPTAADFVNINTMTRVGDHFVGSLNGHLAAALAVAHSTAGGVYPVGTVIQLVPTEAMVKRHKGYSAATHDWEMFSLKVSAHGTRILAEGTTNVVNAFDENCAACHGLAKPQFDFVCGKTHGCAPLPLTDAIIAAVQRADPRPR